MGSDPDPWCRAYLHELMKDRKYIQIDTTYLNLNLNLSIILDHNEKHRENHLSPIILQKYRIKD